MNMKRSLKTFASGNRGASTIEYALIVACLAVATVTSAAELSRSSNRTFNLFRDQLGGGTDTSTPGGNLGKCPFGSVWVFHDERTLRGYCRSVLIDGAETTAPLGGERSGQGLTIRP